MQHSVKIGKVTFSNDKALAFIAGPCSMESEKLLRTVARSLKENFDKLGMQFVLKCSFDKANRTSIKSYRGLGIEKGLEILARVGEAFKVPTLTDVHEPWQAELAAKYVDVLQIPAFLCRQTDLLVASGKTGKPVNIKKGQFLAPWNIKNAIEKVESTGNKKILITERGASFGYGNLVVDMRSLSIMREFGYPVIYDATHSVQLPGAAGNKSGGERQFVAPLARAAAAVGIAGIFMETHPNPEKALSDGPNSLFLKDVPELVKTLRSVDVLVKKDH